MRAFKITSSVFALFNLSMLRDINDQCREYTLLSWPLPGRLQKIWMRCKLACHLHRGRSLCHDFEWHLPGVLHITKSATHLLHILNCSACSNLSWKKSWSMTVKGINIWILTLWHQTRILCSKIILPLTSPPGSLFLLVSAIPLHLSLALSLRLLHLLPLLHWLKCTVCCMNL